MRTFGAQGEVPGKSSHTVSRRICAMLKFGTRNFFEFLTVRQTLGLILSYKMSGCPSVRAQSMDSRLILILNNILDEEVFKNEKIIMQERERENEVCEVELNRDVLCGTGVQLGRAAITRAMQVSSVLCCVVLCVV